MEFREALNAAMAAWLTAVGVDQDGKKLKGVKDIRGYADGWQFHYAVDSINDANKIDPTGVATALLLRGIYTGLIREMKVPVFDLIENQAEVTELMRLVGEFHAAAFSDVVNAETDVYRQTVLDALNHYDIRPEESAEEWVNHLRGRWNRRRLCCIDTPRRARRWTEREDQTGTNDHSVGTARPQAQRPHRHPLARRACAPGGRLDAA